MYTSETESETESESDVINPSDEIFNLEEDYLDEYKDEHKYYIGLPGYIAKDDQLLLLTTISPGTFMKFKYRDVLNYLVEYSAARVNRPNIHILQVHIDEHGAYNVVIKTFWLKLIQRSWKRVFLERARIIDKHKASGYILARFLGKTQKPTLPSIRGLLVKR